MFTLFYETDLKFWEFLGFLRALVRFAKEDSHLINNCYSHFKLFNDISGVAQVASEGMDDTRMDLSQLEDTSTGRSVPSTPLQVSPQGAYSFDLLFLY